MTTFTKVSRTIWKSKRFLNLPSNDAKLLHLYFLTCRHQNICGCFWLPDNYACHDFSCDVETYQKIRSELINARLIKFDEEDEFIMIERWFQHNLPNNPSHRKGALREIELIPDEKMREACLESLKTAYRENEQKKERSAERQNGLKGLLPSHLETGHLNGKH